MKKAFLPAFLLTGLFLHAQSSSPDVLASGGGFATGSGFTNSFTVGQGSIPETFTTGTFLLTQGFQQPADIGLGMAPVSQTADVGAYPNPTNGQLFLDYNLDYNSDVLIEVYDVLGQMVYSETTSHASGHQLQRIDISNQPNGIYFVHCTIKSPLTTTTSTSKITLAR